MAKRIGVLGASGFVGRAVCDALTDRGAVVVPLHAPRLDPRNSTISIDGPTPTLAEVRDHRAGEVAQLEARVSDLDALVNCAGDPGATTNDQAALLRANAELVAVACAAALTVPRFVQVSSAVVQGRRPRLDDRPEYDAFSPYARSKIVAERLLRQCRPNNTVIYRPPGVHAPGRRVTESLTRLARSPLSSVADPTAATPQALLANVADAIAFLALCEQDPPLIVIHPWERLTTAGLLTLLSGRKPRQIPIPLARGILRIAYRLAGNHLGLTGHIRRVEMLWLGQQQDESWLTRNGWEPVADWEIMRASSPRPPR